MLLLQFQLANSRKRALLQMPCSVRTAVSHPENSSLNWKNQTNRFYKDFGVLPFASRELPAVATVHALAEGRHRLVGGAGLGLCVGDLGLLAFAACHTARERKVLTRWNEEEGFFC
jgi:hypothetical protein